MKKTVCYANNCEIVVTGFRVESYFVCRTCKLEVSADVDKRAKERNSTIHDDNKIKQDDYDDMYDLMFGYSNDPMGD